MNKIFLSELFLLSFSWNIVAADVATDELQFDDSIVYQTMDGIGACSNNFPFVSDIGWTWSTAKWVFDDLHLSYMRTAPWFEFWEPSNDNFDDLIPNWSAFGPNGITATHDVGFGKFLTSKSIDVNPGIWALPTWLKNPTNTEFVNAAKLPEVGETIATYMKNLVNNSIPIKMTEVQNEPAITAAVQYQSPETLRDAGLQVIAHLNALGLNNTMLHGPNFHTPPGTVAWAQVWFANSTLASRTAAVSYHTWWSTSFSDFDAIRRFAEGIGKPVWATELGCVRAVNFSQSSWSDAWEYAQMYYRALSWSHASRTYHWMLLGNDAAIDDATGKPYPGYFILKHHANFIPPNSKMVFSKAGDSSILATVFKNPDGNLAAIILNNGSAAKTLRITAASGAALNIVEKYTTSNGSYFIGGATSGTQLVLPAQSISSAVISSQAPKDTIPPAPPTNLRVVPAQ